MSRPQKHQVHAAVHRNARTARAERAAAAPVNVSHATGEDRSVFELDARLTLVQERDVVWQVPHQIAEREPVDLLEINDKVNQLGPMHTAEVPLVTHNDPTSYLSAVNKRSNFRQAKADDDIEDEVFNTASTVITSLPFLFDTWEENDEDRARWLAKFDSSKQKRMMDAWDAIDTHTKKELSSKNGSVKIETLVGKRFDKTAAGRIIYAGTDAFNAVTGPAQMVAMERLCSLLEHEQNGERIYVGGLVQCMLGYKKDDHELSKFIISDVYREVVEGDYSRNDREQRSRVCLLTNLWFNKLGFPAWYLDLMSSLERYTLTNSEFGIKVHLEYQLPTGTTNTTFRNSTYNLTMFVVSCIAQKRKGKCLILGDDLLACLNKRFDLKQWIGDVGKFKMVLKAKSPVLNGEATFLSRRLFTEVDTPFMIPLIGKMLVRFNARACQNPSLSDAAAMAAKALSYAFGCKNVHLFRDLFLRRYESELAKCEHDVEVLDVDALGWHARSNGYTLDDIKRRTMDAPNLVDDDTLCVWLLDVYGIDLYDTLELFEDTVCSDRPDMLEDCRIECFARDYS
jgi:hypothetical protein